MHTTIENSIEALYHAVKTGHFPHEINPLLATTATNMLNELNTQQLTQEQIKEKHDVIMVGVLAWAIKRCFVRGYIGAYPDTYKINLDNPLFNPKIVNMTEINYQESNENIILSLGAALLFNKKYKGLFNPADFLPETSIGNALHPWITEHLKDYHDLYEPRNTYPSGNYSQLSLFQRLRNTSWWSGLAIPREIERFNKENDTQFSAARALQMLNKIESVETLAQKKGGSLKLDDSSVAALFKLQPVVREWLLQGYQLSERGQVSRDIFMEITSYLLKLSTEQTKTVQQHVAYSLYKDTPSSLTFWQKMNPFARDEQKEARLEQRLQNSPS